MTADTSLTPVQEGRDRHRYDRQRQNRREVTVADLDDQVGSIERRKPASVTFRPVVATSQPRAGDAHDRAEYEMKTGDGQRDERQPADGIHRTRFAGFATADCAACIARHVNTNSAASAM